MAGIDTANTPGIERGPKCSIRWNTCPPEQTASNTSESESETCPPVSVRKRRRIKEYVSHTKIAVSPESCGSNRAAGRSALSGSPRPPRVSTSLLRIDEEIETLRTLRKSRRKENLDRLQYRVHSEKYGRGKPILDTPCKNLFRLKIEVDRFVLGLNTRCQCGGGVVFGWELFWSIWFGVGKGGDGNCMLTDFGPRLIVGETQ